jgi:hypothetical protein
VAHESLDLAPVGFRIQADADPALGAKVRGMKNRVGSGLEKDFPRTFRDLAPEREPVVPRPLQSEDLVPTRYDGPRRMTPSFASGSARQIARKRAPIATSGM